MDSDVVSPPPMPRRRIAAGAGLLALGAFGAGACWQAASPSNTAGLVASGTAVLLGAAWLWHGWSAMRVPAALPPLERPVGLPQHEAELAARVLALETQLEFAPIALFRLLDADQHAAFEAVNVNARRLLAPGRASDVAALRRTLSALTTGQRSVIDFDTELGTERALAIAGAVTVEGQPQRLIALMPMENELKAEAMQAWQQLVHVLTHEIMNSLTPVASLSHSARDMLATLRPGQGNAAVNELIDDIDLALDAIARRADSLTHFVSGYRALASVPEARPQRIDVGALFARLAALVAPSWQARGGQASFSVEPASLELMADPGQLEQALVNLIQNAAEACAGHGLPAPQVSINARLVRGGRLRIEVCDNGPGVADHLLADIFTPFFTTKAKGSGIGLAMVRQLVHRNGGAVRYAKAIGGGARFVMTF